MINYEVDPEILMPYLPPHTELDFYKGKSLVSLVGFMFENTKVFGVHWPLHTTFEEVNLRMYVKFKKGSTYRRGVVFISEIVPSPVIAWMANWLYHERYSYAPMRHSIICTDKDHCAHYQWKTKGQWNSLSVTAHPQEQPMTIDSEEAFIYEHYWGYGKYNIQTTIEYGVEHPSWWVYPVKDFKVQCDVAGLYGHQFVPYLLQQPSSVFLAKGSDVLIRKPSFLKISR